MQLLFFFLSLSRRKKGNINNKHKSLLPIQLQLCYNLTLIYLSLPITDDRNISVPIGN